MNQTAYRQRKQRLIALCIAGLLALNYPLLSLFDRVEISLGIPVLFLFLFVFWAIFIAITAMIMERGEREEHRP